ncbi:MAG: hypothetical protein ABSC95_01655 [Acetobacteraceae bacterium]
MVFMAAYFPTLWRIAELLWLQPGSADIFTPTTCGGLFNSMPDHRLAGRFDVDPAVVATEAFVVGSAAAARQAWRSGQQRGSASPRRMQPRRCTTGRPGHRRSLQSRNPATA